MERTLKKLGPKVQWRGAGLVLAALVFWGCGFSPDAKEARFLETGKQYLAKQDYPRAILQFRNAIRAKKSDAEPYYQLGLAYLGTGDLKMAFAAMSKAVELNPKHQGAQVKIAELMLTNPEKENIAEAQKRLGSVLQSAPENIDALNALAISEWDLGKPGDAEQHLQRALRSLPGNFQTTVNLANLHLLQKDLKGAEAVLLKAAAQQPPVANAVIALAEFYSGTQRSAEAEKQFRRAIQIDPKSTLALYDLGNLLAGAGRGDEADAVFKQLSSLPDRRYKPVHAIFLFRSGKTSLAIAEFEKLAKADPKDRTARTMLVQAYWKANRPNDAERVLAQALKENGKDVDALTLRSAVYLAAGKYADAQQDLTQVIRLNPDSAEAHFLLSRVHGVRGEILSQRQELSEAVRLKRDFLPARLELALVLIRTNAAKAALDLMNDTPPAQSKTVPAIVARNWAVAALGDAAELRKGIDVGLSISRTPDLLLQDAQLKMQQQNYSGARADADEILKQTPENRAALNILVATFARQKQLPAGVGKIREFAAKYPKSAPIQMFLGDLYLTSGDRTHAREAFSAARAADPKTEAADFALAQIDASEGKLDQARKTLNSLVANNPGNVQARAMLGHVEEETGDYAAAIEQFRKILEAHPRNIKALNDMAYLLADSANQPDAALRFAERAREIAPESGDVADTLGWVLCRKGLYTVALPHLEFSASRRGATGEQKMHLAVAYFSAGDQKRGQQMLDAALKEQPALRQSKLMAQLKLASGKKEGM